MIILIVGGTGVLSSAVTAAALRQGIEVTMINRGNRVIPDGVEHIKADKDDQDTIAKALTGRQFDAVMDYLCVTNEQTLKSFNFYKQYTKQYFFISSCAVYDTTQSKVCVEDSPKVLEIWDYSGNKWDSEQVLTKAAAGTDTKITVVRPCVTYDDTRIPYGISPMYGYHWTLCARILAGKPIITWNGGQNRCNMTRVEDFAVGVVGLIGNEKAYGEAFNVCGDETPTFKEVLDVLGEYLHKEVLTIDIPSQFYADELPSRAGEILGGRSIDAVNSNKKLCEIVPLFRQTLSLHEGVFKTLDAYKKRNYQHGIDWRFDAETDRIISKWCKKEGIDKHGYNLGFVDYLGGTTMRERMAYCIFRYKENALLLFLMKLRKIIFSH